MKIEFNTDTLSVRDATAIVTTLFLFFPDLGQELDAASFGLKAVTVTDVVGDISRTVSGPVDAVAAFAPPADAPPPPAAEQAFAPPAGAPFVEPAAEAAGSTATVTLAPAAAPAAPSAPSVELDAHGLPWDARIHAETKGKNKDGSWRGRRNVDPAALASVTAELRAALAAPRPTETASAPSAAPAPVTSASAAPASAASPLPAEASSPPPPAVAGVSVPPPPAATAAAEPPPSAPATPAPVAAPAPSASAPAAPPAPAPSAPATAAVEFARVMRKVTEAQTQGRITADLVTAAVQSAGLTALRDLLTRPDLIPTFEATFDGLVTPAAA